MRIPPPPTANRPPSNHSICAALDSLRMGLRIPTFTPPTTNLFGKPRPLVAVFSPQQHTTPPHLRASPSPAATTQAALRDQPSLQIPPTLATTPYSDFSTNRAACALSRSTHDPLPAQ